MKVILTDHDLGVMDEAVDALFRSKQNVHAVALGALTLRLRGQNAPVMPLRDNVVELHGFSRKVSAGSELTATAPTPLGATDPAEVSS